MSKRGREPKSTRGISLGNLADVAPGDPSSASEPTQKITIDVGDVAARMLRRFELHTLEHGPLDGLDQLEQVIVRSAREFVEYLEQTYNEGQQFSPPQRRLPKGRRAGTLAPDEQLDRFGARMPQSLLNRVRGALLFFALHDEARENEQIGMAPEFYSRALVATLTELAQRTGVALNK